MKQFTLAVVASVTLLLPCTAVLGAQQRVPRGAYVRQRVSSVDQLANQITRDPVVRNRFARHFGVPPEQIGQYIRENVVITKVTTSTPRNVYICTRSGRLVAQRKVLRPGTPVFALKDTGEPLLVQACGNPVLAKLPPRVKVKAVTPQVYQVTRANEVPFIPPPKAPPVVAPPPVAAAPPAVVPPVVPPVVVPPAAVVPPVVARGGPPLWPLLGVLPFLGGGGGGGGGGVVPPPPPVPEPAGSAAVIATAFLPLIGLGLKSLFRHGA